MTAESTPGKVSADGLEAIAGRFVAARKAARPLVEFPGTIPPDLDTAYRIQNIAIGLRNQAIGGWKVGRIPPAVEGDMGIDRLAGPIFANTIVDGTSDETIDMPIFDGGFAAIEAEYVAVIGSDAPADKTEWSADEAAEMIADLRIGLEVASSPLATINDLGPVVVVSDFGNNAGLIVGPSIADWQTRPLESMECEAFVDGREVGEGGAFRLTGGFVRSVQFLLELNAARHMPLRAGDVVATGQTTGIHDVRAGQEAVLRFGEDGELRCRFHAASAAN